MAEIRVKETGTIKLFESDNTSSVTIASPASLGADRTITLPDANVTLASGTMLATDGSGASLTGLPDNTPAFQADFGDTSPTSLADSTWVKLECDTEVFDTDGDYDNSSTYRFTPTTAGKYYLYLKMSIDSGVNMSYFQLGLKKNGNWLLRNSVRSNTYEGHYLATVADMNGSSDYIEAFAYQNSGGAVSPETGEDFCFWGGYKLIGV